MMPLLDSQRMRYARHISLAGMGEEGVSRLLSSRVLIVGAGGLASSVSLYLAAAGIGHLAIVDDDEVSLHNLQRQIVHGEADVGHSKVESAKVSMLGINSTIEVEAIATRLDVTNAEAMLAAYDIVLDCVDGLESKLLINDVCCELSIPFVHASVLGWYGQVMTYVPGKGPCYRCFLGDNIRTDAHATCKTEGIAGPLVGVIGSLQALEAVKFIAGTGDLITGRMLVFDGLRGEFEEIDLTQNPSCKACK